MMKVALVEAHYLRPEQKQLPWVLCAAAQGPGSAKQGARRLLYPT